MVVLARIGKPHGLRGEVTVQLHTDDPQQRFTLGTEFATEPAERGPLVLTSVRVHQDVYLLGFAGHRDRSAAESLRGIRLVVDDPTAAGDPRADAVGDLDAEEAQEGWYEDDLLGFTVTLPDGTTVGEVSGLHTRDAQDVLEVRLSTGGQALVPFVHQLVPEVDDDARRVVIDPPDGLLELGG